MTDRYAVIGNPVAHSRSPQIHAAFAAQCGHDIDYRRLLAPLDGFADCVEQFFAGGGKGANVTLPFKLEACRLASCLSERASLARAVNTLTAAQGGLSGDNTDGVGLTRDIEGNLGFAIAEARVLIMGAGGAVRGVIAPVLERRPACIVIANRTPDRAHALARQFAGPVQVVGCGYGDLDGREFDLVINGTAASLSGAVPPLPGRLFGAGSLAYDMMYSREPTAFMRYALRRGAARVVDGLGMLVEQAAESFHIWRGVRPQTAPVIEALRDAAL
jgi:shikimate dehydrogenase